MQTMEQRRAKYALEQVKKARQEGIKPERYKSYASNLPAMIQMNGLGQTAAFYRSKGVDNNEKGKAYMALYQTLSDWLVQPGQPYQGSKGLLEAITEKNIHSYLRAQAEAVALLSWVKKFAKAFMEGES
jgi:CRISPR-associated protein Cmr5